MKQRQITLCFILGTTNLVSSASFVGYNSNCIDTLNVKRLSNNNHVSCLFAKDTKKSKIAGPRASSRPTPASRQNQNENNNNENNAWNVLKGNFYNARDVIENGMMKSSSNKQVGAGYQDNNNDDDDDTNVRARLLIQKDEADLNKIKSPSKSNNSDDMDTVLETMSGWFFASSSDKNKKQNKNNESKNLNPIVKTLSQPSRNSPDTTIKRGRIQEEEDSLTNMKKEIQQSPIEKILQKTGTTVSLLQQKNQKSNTIKQISMMEDVPDTQKKLTDQIQEIPQAIRGNIETTRRTAKEIQDKMNTLEESYSNMIHKFKVLLKQEKPKLKPHPPKPKPKLRTSDIAKFSLEAGSGLTVGLFKSIGSSTAWAVNKAMEKQKDKQNLQSLVDNDWTKNVQKYDPGDKTTEELLAEFDPDLSAEVAEALRLAQEALDAAPPTAEEKEEQTTDMATPEPVVDLPTNEDEIIQEPDLDTIVSEEVKEEEEEEILLLDVPDTITAPDTAELEEEIESFLAKEHVEFEVKQTSKKSKTTLKNENTEIMQEVEDALTRARKAAEEAKRDVEELQRMLQDMS